MKLKTKLLFGSGLIFIVAFCTCAGLILIGSINSVLNVITDHTTTQQQLLVTHFTSEMKSASSSHSTLAQRSRATYVFSGLSRSIGEDIWYVLLQGEDVLQNDSGIALRDISRKDEIIEETPECYHQQIGENWYCIAQSYCTVGKDIYTVGVIRDITDDMTTLTQQTILSIGICISALVLAMAAISLFVAKSLLPIQNLQQGANAIATGDYKKRITIKANDEVGQLASCFNEMALAIQNHVNQVEEVSEDRKLLLRALAHEMRTPVTAISGYAHALCYAKLDEKDQQEAIAFIHSESLRLERLSSKLTELITLEDFRIEADIIEAGKFAKSLSRILYPIAEKSFIQLSITSGGCIYGDQDLLTSVLTNLFDNAKKAGANYIQIELRSGFLRVSDNGKGIPAAEIEKITQPFYQVDSSRHEGFGLGLSLCNKIAQLHGGLLQIESNPGVGSIITISLQLHDDSQMAGTV